MAATTTNPSVDELERREEELFQKGPLQVLTNSVKTNSQVSWHSSARIVHHGVLKTNVDHPNTATLKYLRGACLHRSWSAAETTGSSWGVSRLLTGIAI